MANRATLIKEIRDSAGVSWHIAAQCVDIMLDTLFVELSNGEGVELRGLGTFTVDGAAPRKWALNGDSVSVLPAHGRVRFRPCQKLRRAVWNRGSKV